MRYAGEAVAVVLGDDRYRAEDGAAEITFHVDPLPAVVTPSAAAEDSVRLFDGLSNIALQAETGKPIDESGWHADARQRPAGLPAADVHRDPAHRGQGHAHTEPSTPLGTKGAGESGCIGTPAAVVNAVIDALQITDPDLLQMPLTPDVVWRAARAPKLEEVR